MRHNVSAARSIMELWITDPFVDPDPDSGKIRPNWRHALQLPRHVQISELMHGPPPPGAAPRRRTGATRRHRRAAVDRHRVRPTRHMRTIGGVCRVDADRMTRSWEKGRICRPRNRHDVIWLVVYRMRCCTTATGAVSMRYVPWKQRSGTTKTERRVLLRVSGSAKRDDCRSGGR